MGMSKVARMMMMGSREKEHSASDKKDYVENHKKYDGKDYKKESYHEEFDRKSAEHWASKMRNEDGTTGAHWTMEQTTAVAKEHGVKFEYITDYCWFVTMNMVYSDYYAVAVKNGCNTVAFYADMAKAFLFDKDAKSPRDKISAYYEYVVM